MTDTTLYTVISRNSGEPEGRHLTVAQAASIILNDDSAEYDIREGIDHEGDRRFELWTRKECASKPWTITFVFSYAPDRAQAEAEIFQDVIDARWDRHPEAMTDAAYDVMMAECLADQV